MIWGMKRICHTIVDMIDDQLNMGFIPAQGCWFCLLMNSFFGAG
jgi:hypothetical protein